MSRQATIRWKEMAQVFLRTGAYSFGGWSTTALLLEKELTIQRKVLSKNQLHGAVAYAQILPGATQVAIVSNAGFKLRGAPGALLATVCYLLPALSLITGFAAVYFHYIRGPRLMDHLSGLIAALGGIILANAYNIGKRHATHRVLWVMVAGAAIAKLGFGINAIDIILVFGTAGLGYSWFSRKGQSA